MNSPFVTDHSPRIGEAEELVPGLRVVTAPNAGPMTFTGTRSYILGYDRLAVIDPGPDEPSHHRALMDATRGATVTHILVTHAHVDHAPLARRLSEELDVPISGFGDMARAQARFRGDRHGGVSGKTARLPDLGGGEGIDHGHDVDESLDHGTIVSGGDWVLEALHTPGHLADHLCFAWRETGIVFTGDHIMGWATTMVSPPHGDMQEFMQSLRRMAERAGDRVFFPGHGGAVEDPHAMIDWQIRHRLDREQQILDALSGRTLAPEEIAGMIYSGIDGRLISAATRNVIAHLVDLEARGRVQMERPGQAQGRYRLV